MKTMNQFAGHEIDGHETSSEAAEYIE